MEPAEQEQTEQLVALLIMVEEQQLTALVAVEVDTIIFHQVVIQLQEQVEQELVLVVEHQEQEL